jgi:Zn-dependent peptidase ImmA (M78 family)
LTRAHEFVHLKLHRNEKTAVFGCYDDTSSGRDPFMEWQANEGAAEILVPHRSFLKDVQSMKDCFSCPADIDMSIKALAQKYKVTENVISIRFESLSFEVGRVLGGSDPMGVPVVTSKVKKLMKNKITSVNDVKKKYKDAYKQILSDPYML